MRVILSCCFLLLLASAGFAAEHAVPEPGSNTVDLVFAWQPGLRTSVTTTKSRTRVTNERTTRSATSRYTLVVGAEGENLRIHFEDPSFELGEQADSLPASAREQLVAQVADMAPDYVVSRSGAFIGIHDLPGFQKKLEAFLEKIFPDDLESDMLQKIQGMISSEAFLNARAAEQWNAVVGAWVGAEFELGEAYTHSSREPVPVFPGQQILMNYSFSAVRLVPCQRGGADRRCAELEMRSVADPEDTKRMIQAFLSNVIGDELPVAPVFRTLEIENVIRVVTEPNGLLPHALSITKTLKGTVSAGGQEQDIEQVDETKVSYAYP